MDQKQSDQGQQSAGKDDKQEPRPNVHEKSLKNTEDKMTDPDYKAVKRQIDKANDDRRTTKQSKQRK